MSEFAVVLRWDGLGVDRHLLKVMNQSVRPRCPDGSWIWADGPVGMAQSDLATLPEDEPGVPVSAWDIRIAASCRIDNRDEIRRDLPKDCIPPGETDAALILAAYRAWGDSCANRLIGDFAFAIWDAGRRRLFAARDFSGAFQLYMYQGDERLYLVSDRTMALQDSTIPIDVDEEQVVEFLTPTYRYASGWDLGMLRGFQAVPAGSVLRVEHRQVHVSRFWSWRDTPADRRAKQDVLEEYKDRLQEAVRCRLRSRTPVAIELSGGLDSSAVASLAAQLSDGSGLGLHTISHVFDEALDVDERSRIQAVLDRYPQLSAHFLTADLLYGPQYLRPDWSPMSILGPLEGWIPAAFPRSYQIVNDAGCRVVLTGDVGDALNVGSDRVYFDLLRRRDWRDFLRWFGNDWERGKVRACRRLFLHGMLPLMLPLPLFQLVLLIRESLHQAVGHELPAYVPVGLAKRIRDKDRAVRLEQAKPFLVRSPSVRSTIRRVLPPQVPVTAKFPVPIEIRYPYLDRRLFEMVLSMPQELKWDCNQRGNRQAGRLHHREALATILPDEVRLGNLGVDFGSAIRKSNPSTALRQWLLDETRVQLFEHGYVVPKLFLTAIDDYEKGLNPEGLSYLLAFFCLEGWLRDLSAGGRMHQLIPPRARSRQFAAG